MPRSIRLAALASCATLAAMLAIGSAQAVTITSTAPTWSNLVDGTNSVLNRSNGSFTEVRWGDPAFGGGVNARSGLGFDPASPPAITVPVDTTFLLGTLQHYNNPISAGSAASSVQLNLLTTIAGAVPSSQTFQYKFNINETANAYPCAFASGNNPCADQITFQNLDTTSSFSIGGVNYTLMLSGFSTNGGRTFTNDFISQEGATNQAGLYGRITAATPVPEPASMALLGSGLVGLGLIRKRRQKA